MVLQNLCCLFLVGIGDGSNRLLNGRGVRAVSGSLKDLLCDGIAELIRDRVRCQLLNVAAVHIENSSCDNEQQNECEQNVSEYMRAASAPAVS